MDTTKAPPAPADVPVDKNEAAFLRFHEENPAMFELFCRFAFEVREVGVKRAGAAMIRERMRWEYFTNPEYKGIPFTMNNNHGAYYARLAMQTYPEYFDGFFATRTQKANAPKKATRRTTKAASKPKAAPAPKVAEIVAFTDLAARKAAKAAPVAPPAPDLAELAETVAGVADQLAKAAPKKPSAKKRAK